MIAPLRRRHRWITAALLIALPVLYLLAILARPAPPVMEEIPAAVAGSELPAAPGSGGGDG